MTTISQRRKSKGLASVELALVAPIFLMVMLATAELGRALYQYDTLTKLVRGGGQYLARACMVNGGGLCLPDSTSQANAKNLIVYGSITGGTTPLLPGLTTANVVITTPGSSTYVAVTATYTYVPMLTKIPTFTGGTVSRPTTMTASVTMAGL